mmetsp:Transcript_18040/g.45135  ORF Transcript_18040/g.45135 Transcript_18040/m.45135 type:complete len:211 (+) Transcript_18040:730-1362(+)
MGTSWRCKRRSVGAVTCGILPPGPVSSRPLLRSLSVYRLCCAVFSCGEVFFQLGHGFVVDDERHDRDPVQREDAQQRDRGHAVPPREGHALRHLTGVRGEEGRPSRLHRAVDQDHHREHPLQEAHHAPRHQAVHVHGPVAQHKQANRCQQHGHKTTQNVQHHKLLNSTGEQKHDEHKQVGPAQKSTARRSGRNPDRGKGNHHGGPSLVDL